MNVNNRFQINSPHCELGPGEGCDVLLFLAASVIWKNRTKKKAAGSFVGVSIYCT